jgi:hypothetical protein
VNGDVQGTCEKLGDEFEVQFADIHYSKKKLVEFIPDSKVVWQITDSKLNFLQQKDEWTGSKISFEISKQGDKTKMRFTHHGLVPNVACYNDCSNAWTEYLNGSLLNLITTGKGQPFSNASFVAP